MKLFKYIKNVTTLKYGESKCIGCFRCLEVCPHDVFRKNGKIVKMRDKDDCMECGACALNCAAGAISVRAGVGCAAAVINGALGKKGSDCCCS